MARAGPTSCRTFQLCSLDSLDGQIASDLKSNPLAI